MEASRNTDEHRPPGRANTKKNPTTHGFGPRDHEARPHSVLVPSASTLTRDTAASAAGHAVWLSPVSDPFQSRHPCKVLCMFQLDACHGGLIRCVLEGFIHSFEHIASISQSAPSRCECECFQGSRDCPIHVTPILFPAAILLAEQHKRGELPEFPVGVLSQHCVARVRKADGSHGQKVRR